MTRMTEMTAKLENSKGKKKIKNKFKIFFNIIYKT